MNLEKSIIVLAVALVVVVAVILIMKFTGSGGGEQGGGTSGDPGSSGTRTELPVSRDSESKSSGEESDPPVSSDSESESSGEESDPPVSSGEESDPPVSCGEESDPPVSSDRQTDGDVPATADVPVGEVDAKTGKVEMPKSGTVTKVEKSDAADFKPTIQGSFASKTYGADGKRAHIDLIIRWAAAPTSDPDVWLVQIKVELMSYSASVGARDNGEILLDGHLFSYDSPAISIKEDKQTVTPFSDGIYQVTFAKGKTHSFDLAANWCYGGTYGAHKLQWVATGGTVTLK